MVAKELHSGRLIRTWQDKLIRLRRPPYPIDDNSLVVAYYISAEVGCHLSLGWPTPTHLLDLFTEFKVLANGRNPPCGFGLLGALTCFGFSGIDAAEKDSRLKTV